MPNNIFGIPDSELPHPGFYGTGSNDVSSNTIECYNCGNRIIASTGHESDGEIYCENCAGVCGVCNSICSTDELESSHPNPNSHDTVLTCERCRFVCSDCGISFTSGVSQNSNPSGETVCGRCAESYTRCDHCETIILRYGSLYDENNETTYCSRCYNRREVLEDAPPARPAPPPSPLLRYDYKPSPRYYFTPGEEKQRIAPLMLAGIELEVDRKIPSLTMAADIASAGIPDNFYCKKDGSLTYGMELVSHPASYDYWMNMDLSFLRKLYALGYKGSLPTCGMHIHISRNALSKMDIFKLLRFFRRNRGFIAYVARRKDKEKMEHYAKISGGSDNTLARKVYDRYYSENRYEAINLQNTQTVEFRIFQGTINPRRVRRNIAFIYALIHFLRSTSADLNKEGGVSTPSQFKLWLKKDGKRIIGSSQQKDLSRWIDRYSLRKVKESAN